MITKAQWFNNQSYQTDLKALLEHPVLKVALEICRDQNLIPIPTNNRVGLTEYFAIIGAKKEGYNEFYMNLRELARTDKPDVPEVKPWTLESTPQPEAQNNA